MIRKTLTAATPTIGYGLAALSGVYLACLAFLVSGLGGPIVVVKAQVMPTLGLALMAALAMMLTGLSINRRAPLTEPSSAIWIWLMAVLAPPRLAVFTLSDRWGPGAVAEVVVLSAAVALVLLLPPRSARTEGEEA